VIDQVDIVVFEIGGHRYGADMTQVRRIDRADVDASVGAPLGRPTEGRRSLVFSPDGERELHLAIDVILGVHTVSRDDLRRLPVAVGPTPFVIGAWLDRNEAVLLVDLHSTNPFRPTEATHA
jgi:chemotaxis signal transduction protein